MSNRKINVGLFCRILPHYRLPVFEELAKAADIDLMVYYSRKPSYYRTLKTIDPGDRFPNRRIKMRALKLAGQELLFQPELKRIIESGRHDVIILSGNLRLLSNYNALLAAKRRRVGVVWWTMGRQPLQSWITMRINIWLIAIPDAVLVYTHDEKRFLTKKGVPDRKVFVAQNTIDVTPEKDAAKAWSEQQLQQFTQRQGLDRKKTFIFCGQLRPRKQMDLLFKALKIILSKDQDYRLVVAGGSPIEAELKELGTKMGLSPAITWLGPMYEPEKLAPWFLSSRALVVPRAIGLALLHGFAYGLPCITSEDRDYQTPEVAALKHGYNCLLCRDGDAGDLAEKMKLMAENDGLRALLSANAKATVNQEYTLDKMVDGFVQAIRYAARVTDYGRTSFKI